MSAGLVIVKSETDCSLPANTRPDRDLTANRSTTLPSSGVWLSTTATPFRSPACLTTTSLDKWCLTAVTSITAAFTKLDSGHCHEIVADPSDSTISISGLLPITSAC